MFKRLAEWIASIVRKELAELAAAFGKDFEEQAKRAEADLAAIKAHVLAVYYLERRFLGQLSRLPTMFRS